MNLATEAGTRSSPRSPNVDEASLSSFAKSTPTRSQPIAIELPAPKKISSAPVYTPPAPLSGRGDLPGYVTIRNLIEMVFVYSTF